MEAFKVILMLPNKMKDVGEQLSRVHGAEKEEARDMLRLIFQCSLSVHCRHGL